MTATPVVNDLKEGVALLELVTGRDLRSVRTNPNQANANCLHQLLMLDGIRYRPNPKQARREQLPDVDGSGLMDEICNAYAEWKVLGVERVLVRRKLEFLGENPDLVRSGSLVYTHYVEGILGPVVECMKRLDFKVGTFT